MIFWIVVALTVIAILFFTFRPYGAVYRQNGYWNFDGEYLGITVLFCSLVGGMVVGIVAMLGTIAPTEYKLVRSETADLQALTSKDSQYGRLFLFSGYSDSYNSFSYLTNDDGAIRSNRVSASSSVLYEDEPEDPSVTAQTWDWYNPVWVPWVTYTTTTYEFHIPPGSVSTDISVAP